MKKLILLSALFFAKGIHAQAIIHADGKAGLIDSAGKILLPISYDEITNFEQSGNPSEYFICRSNGLYGLYCTYDKVATPCIYQSIYAKHNMLFLTSGGKTGFVAQSYHAYRIIEPVYTYVFPLCENAHVASNDIHSFSGAKISAMKDSLWGVLNFSDGSEVLPFKYRHEVTQREGNTIWVSEDGPNGTEILINPATGAEFPTGWMSKRQLNVERTFLLSYYYYGITELHYHVEVWDFATGQVMWTYESLANDLDAHFVNETTVLIEEKFDAAKEFTDNGKKVYSFYNITNSALLLKHEDKSESDIDIRTEDNKLMIYVSPTYNGKKKFIGEIFR